MDKVFEFFGRIAFTIGDESVTFGQILAVPTVLVIGYLLIRWAARVISNRMTTHGVNPDIVHLVRRIFYALAFAVLAITGLDLVNVPLTAFAFVSGAIAIGLGFGAQNIINNFISGWILMWERPIRIDDFLEIGPDRGKVEAINTRSTRIRRTDGVHMLIPNSALLENTVVNWTLMDKKTRTVVRVGVAYGSPARKVADLLLQAATDEPAVLKDPAPVVMFEDFGDSALIFDVFFWIEAAVDRDIRIVRSNMRFRIDELFREQGVVIAFPQSDIHIDGSINVHSKS